MSPMSPNRRRPAPTGVAVGRSFVPLLLVLTGSLLSAVAPTPALAQGLIVRERAATAAGPPRADLTPARELDPNPFRFGKDPRDLRRWTARELWDAVDYLVRIDQAPAAVPFLNAFLARKPDDATLLAVRDEYGLESILRLQDHPATASRALPVLNLVTAASRRDVTVPERLDRYVAALAATPTEQAFALERLREARAAGVAPALRALADPAVPAESKALIAANLGRLDPGAVPPLLAALDAPDPSIVAAVARALGRIRDPRAIPFLLDPAARPDAPPAVREAAVDALARLGLPGPIRPADAAARLAAEARRYFDHQVGFPDGPFETWVWQGNAPVPQRSDRAATEARFARRFASQALGLDPKNLLARTVLTGLSLMAERTPAAERTMEQLDPAVVASLLKLAIERGDGPLGAAAAEAMGRLSTAEGLAAQGETHPLVRALESPNRRIRLAAARAIVALQPTRPFAGSSRVTGALIPFINGGRNAPRAVVVDGSTARAGAFAAVFQSLGYDVTTAPDGPGGFRLAAESADVELVLVEPAALQGPWSAADLLSNLRADARTARLPVLLARPIDLNLVAARAAQLATPTREIEPNDLHDQATGLRFSDRPREARVAGDLATYDNFGDLYALGRLAAGDSILAALAPAAYGSLDTNNVTLTVEQGNSTEGLTAGLGRVSYTIPADGLYYLRVTSPRRGRGNTAGYVLDVRLIEQVPAPVATGLAAKLDALAERYPRVAVLAAPEDAGLMRSQIERALGRFQTLPLGDDERDAYAREATELLARIAAGPRGPLSIGLTGAEPALALALNYPSTAIAAAAALAEIPGAPAQRSLAATLIDTATPRDVRLQAAGGLTRSIGRFGRLVTADQERQLFDTSRAEPDPTLRAALGRVLQALAPAPVRNVPAG